ncbi:MAG: class I SAM-dependent methyltransferase, partial [Actinobacteria bacterium]|nr:class I SAM-dependent methyltransferase [Actinomycetota bacterium]
MKRNGSRWGSTSLGSGRAVTSPQGYWFRAPILSCVPGSLATHPSACPICASTGGREVLCARDHRRGMPGEFRVVECTSCRLCRTDPWPDDPGAWYPDEYPQHAAGESVTARASRLALQRAGTAPGPVARALGVTIPEAETGGPMRPGMRVLDVGAGTGGAVLAFRDAGHEAWGVDPSARAVEVARERGNTWVLQGSLDALVHDGSLPDGPWDVIRMSQVLEHVPDPLATLGVIRGLLAPGGRLIVGVPNIRSLAARATRGAWDGLELPRHLVHYDRDSLRWVLALAGFRVMSLRTTPLMGVLPGSLDARTAGGDRQRGWGDALPVR